MVIRLNQDVNCEYVIKNLNFEGTVIGCWGYFISKNWRSISIVTALDKFKGQILHTTP